MKRLSHIGTVAAFFLSLHFFQPLAAQWNHNLFIGSDAEQMIFQTAELNVGYRVRHSFQADVSLGYMFNRNRRNFDFVPYNKERGGFWKAGISFYPRISANGVLRLVAGVRYVQSYWNHRWEIKIPYYYGEFQDAGAATGVQRGLNFPMGLEFQMTHSFLQFGMEVNFFNSRSNDELTSRGYFSPGFGGISERNDANGSNLWLFCRFGWFFGSSFMDS